MVALLAGACIIFAGFLLWLNQDDDIPSSSLQDGRGRLPIVIAGSTTVQPVSEILASVYMRSHQNHQIIVEGGGSGAGIRRAGTGEIEIGATSRSVKDEEFLLYPDLRVHQIGGSGIVVIASLDYPGSMITFEDLLLLYNDQDDHISNMGNIRNIRVVVQRKDHSGTEEVFAEWLFPGSKDVDSALYAHDTSASGPVIQMAMDGNAGVLRVVKEHIGAIGFVDFGYAEHDPGVKILRIVDKGSQEAVPRDLSLVRKAILNEFRSGEMRDETLRYVPGLTRPLAYVTEQNPDDEVMAFIDFARSSDARRYFNEIGYFSMNEIDELVM
ncbi:PstS family phosphate ABC transporter substrate-binding protein [Methanocalculus chunghsingensis]|nr:PstS family phosphate ABC transporter substrate-binding protein [Methanocalculus chunghsingensis]